MEDSEAISTMIHISPAPIMPFSFSSISEESIKSMLIKSSTMFPVCNRMMEAFGGINGDKWIPDFPIVEFHA